MTMARPYSDDLRQKLLEAYDQGKGSLVELAKRFGVSLGWAWKISSARKRTGRMERPSYQPGPKRRIDEPLLAGLLRDHADATLVELQAELKKKSGLGCSTQHLWRVLKRMGFRLKKSHSTPRNATRKPTANDARSSSKPSAALRRRSCVSTQMTRRYARGMGGARIAEGTPQGHWKILTILGAMSTRGLFATMTIEAATDRDIFLAYLDHVLCPKLRPGDVVVMDNLSAHKVKGVRERIEAVGAGLLYALPASLLARPKPHRKGLGQAQATVALGPSTEPRSARSGHHGTAPASHCRGCNGLVQAPLHRSTEIGEML